MKTSEQHASVKSICSSSEHSASRCAYIVRGKSNFTACTFTTFTFALFIVFPIFFSAPAHSLGENISMDYTLTRLATEFNDARAQYLIGRKYYLGNGVDQDKVQAAFWFTKAAGQNHVKAKYLLGKMALYGDGISANYLSAFDLLTSAASQDHIEAQFELANYYIDSKYGHKNSEKAIQLYNSAANDGHLEAQYILGKIYYEGNNAIKKDIKKGKEYLEIAADYGQEDAIKYLEKLKNSNPTRFKSRVAKKDKYTIKTNTTFANIKNADSGNVDAQYALGIAYLKGKGLAKDPSSAATWLRKAAKQNHAGAQYQLGILYRDGIGVSKSESEAIKWFRLATSWGVTSAQYDLDALLRKQIIAGSDFENNKELAKPDAQYTLGTMYAKGRGIEKDSATAAQWFLKAAMQNHHEAQFKLGEMYNSGTGVDIDKQEAKRWLNKAADGGLNKASKVLKEILYAEKDRIIEHEIIALNSSDLYTYLEEAKDGDTDAQFQVAMMYLTGKNVTKDVEKGIHWLQLAAEDDNSDAQLKLGNMYSNGLIIDQSFSTAAKWYKLAAEQGDANAQYNLGNFYRKGKGIRKSHSRALKWYRLAAKQGHEKALERINQ